MQHTEVTIIVAVIEAQVHYDLFLAMLVPVSDLVPMLVQIIQV